MFYRILNTWESIKIKITILKIKIFYRKFITVKWSDVISPSVKFRINGNGHIEFGESVVLRENCIFNVSDGGNIKVGDRCFFNDSVYINSRKSIIIQNDCIFGQGVKIYDHDHDYKSFDFKNSYITDEIFLGHDSWICSDVILLRGTFIGDNCVVAAGTIFKGTLENEMLVFNRREREIHKRIINR